MLGFLNVDYFPFSRPLFWWPLTKECVQNGLNSLGPTQSAHFRFAFSISQWGRKRFQATMCRHSYFKNIGFMFPKQNFQVFYLHTQITSDNGPRRFKATANNFPGLENFRIRKSNSLHQKTSIYYMPIFWDSNSIKFPQVLSTWYVYVIGVPIQKPSLWHLLQNTKRHYHSLSLCVSLNENQAMRDYGTFATHTSKISHKSLSPTQI